MHFRYEDSFRDEEAKRFFDTLVSEVRSGATHGDGVTREVLKYALFRVPANDFDAGYAAEFTETFRQLAGWPETEQALNSWVESRLMHADPEGIPESFFHFACTVARLYLKFGPSYRAREIFDQVTALGSPLAKQLQKTGSMDLPRINTAQLSAKANDVLATITITIKEESEENYRIALEYLCRILDIADFPRSFSFTFRGPRKEYLKGLARNCINQFFTSAAAYPQLHPLIADYARSAMRLDEWYLNLSDSAMPGTYAVFSLGWLDTAYIPLVCDFLDLVDYEHQYNHHAFIKAYIQRHGFTPDALRILASCPEAEHVPAYAKRVAHAEILKTILALPDDTDWENLRYALWGMTMPSSKDLAPLYDEFFAGG